MSRSSLLLDKACRCALEALEDRKLLSVGAPDLGFGIAGNVFTPLGTDGHGNAVVVQPDGRFVVAGSAGGNFVLARYLANGALDGSFGSGGKVVTDFGGVDAARALALQPDGRIVAVGVSGDNFAVARYTASGVLDSSFDGDGRAVTDFGGNDEARAVAIQPDGRIVVAGQRENYPTLPWVRVAVARFTAAGALDGSFDGDGKALYEYAPPEGGSITQYSDAVGLGIQADGRIVIGGTSYIDRTDDDSYPGYYTDYQFSVLRLDSNGSVNAQFSTPFVRTVEYARDMLLQPDGSVVVLGSYEQIPGQVLLVRFNANGAIVNSNLDAPLEVPGIRPVALAQTTSGALLVVGRASETNSFEVAQLAPNFQQQYIFGGQGLDPADIAVQGDGGVLVAGSDTRNGLSGFSITRFLPTAAPVDAPLHLPFGVGQLIEAEDFDIGGEGVAWHDTDFANLGGQYRVSGVDVERTSDAGGGYNVGWAKAGEWLKYTVQVNSSGYYNIDFRVASPSVGGTFHLESDGVRITPNLAVPATGNWQSFATLRQNSVFLGAGRHVLRLVMDTNGSSGFVGNFNWLKLSSAARSPFNGTPVLLPNTVQAENFDNGGEGIAWHDTDAANLGGAYRNTSVDIQGTTDAGGGYNVGWTRPGEWLEYTVAAPVSGLYRLELRVAATLAGGSMHLEVAGNNRSGDIALPATGGWQTYTTVSRAVWLDAGTQVVRLAFDRGSSIGFASNLNWFRLTPLATLPGRIQAEDFNVGAEGVAYHDTDAANLGGAYRSTGVDIQAITDTGGGYNVGWTRPGEWLAYTASIAQAGTYNVDFRVASAGRGGTFHLEVDSKPVTASVVVPDTGGWQNFQTITVPGVILSSGEHLLRLVFDSAGPTGFVGNFDWFEVR